MDTYAVVGNPIEHSLSPQIHSLFAEQTGQVLRYKRRLVSVEGFAEFADQFCAEGASGFNVTVPFKTEAHDWVDELDEEARAAGAVNTVVFDKGKSVGFNTDGIGLVKDLVTNQQLQIRGKRVLLLGSGGAVLGVVGRLLKEMPARLVIANRTPSKAQQLAVQLIKEPVDAGCEIVGVGLESVVGDFDLVINGTSAGLQGQGNLIDASLVRGAACYDLVYGHETPFTRWALQAGAVRVVDGLGMLVEQAAASFYLWRGVYPQTSEIISELSNAR